MYPEYCMSDLLYPDRNGGGIDHSDVYVTMKMVKNEESYIIKSFFKSFRQNFKQATVINLIMLAVAAILYVDLRIVNQMGQPISQIMHVIFLAFTVLYAMVFMYIYPVLAKF